jgi:uncharacterized repeat protein (TIGR01451 family)
MNGPGSLAGHRRARRVGGPLARPPYRPALEVLERRLVPAGEITGTESIVTPFTPRFATNDTGDITAIGNTLETASVVNNPGRTPLDVANAQNGVGGNVNNNNWFMAYVDVDNNPFTFNSSQATLSLPAGATVLFAGLYWGSVTTTDAQAASRTSVQFSTPLSNGYVSLNGSLTGATDFTGTPPGSIYQGFADVTTMVSAAGNGVYGVANVQATLETGSYAGWSLVVAYRSPSAPARNLTVFDGFAVQAATDPALNIPISGFTTPPSGPVNATLSVVTYEGDLGTLNDTLSLNDTRLSDATHPVNNFFNSSISNQGAAYTAKNPNYPNQMGFDVANIKVPAGVIHNSDTSAVITLTTSGDGYFPGVVTTAIDLFSPSIQPAKSFTDLNGGLVHPGDVIEYTVTLPNSGQDAATNLVFRDPIPANTTYVPGSLQVVSGANAGAKTDAAGDDQAEFDAAGNQVVYRLGAGANAATGGTLAIGASTTVRFRVTVNAGTPDQTVIVNQGVANFNGKTTGFALSADSNQVGFAVNSQADLQLLKQVSKANPNVGDTITYTLTLGNLGPATATGVFVKDLLPVEVRYVSSNASQGVYNNATGFWDVGTLAFGAQAVLTISAVVVSPNPSVNVGTADANQTDPNLANNTASAVLIPQKADLALVKTVNNLRPNVGDIITFTLALTNNGPSTATNVQVSDPLPPSLVFQSALASQGSYDPFSGLWTVNNLTNGATAALTITAKVTTIQPEVNAAVASADQFDSNPGNNSSSVNVTPQYADLAITKVSSVDLAVPQTPGTPVTFTIRLENNGPDTATNVTVQDSLAPGLTLISLSQGSYDTTSGVWTVGNLAPHVVAFLTLGGTVPEGGTLTNVATVSHADQFDPDLSNNTATATADPPVADLALVKQVSNARPNVGDTITFTLTLTNKGPDGATNVKVVDPLPAGLTFLGANASKGSYDPIAGVWSVGGMANGEQATLTITARVDAAAPSRNLATADSDQFDPDLSDNSPFVDVKPQQADLEIVKSVDNPTPKIGDTVTYTITVTNRGPDDATNVVARDLVPVGLGFVSHAETRGIFFPGIGTWVIGDLPSGASATLTVQVVVDVIGEETNFVVVAGDQFDPVRGNNLDSATLTVAPPSADLAVAKTVDKPTPNVGNVVTFTVTVTNNGEDTATDVAVTDFLPAGLAYVSSTASSGSYDPLSGQWFVGTVAVGTPQTLQIEARVLVPGTQTNTATIARANEIDPNPDNNSASASETTQQVDLHLTKVVDPTSVQLGFNVTYTIVINNRGPDTATNVFVIDPFPPGLTVVGASPSQGVYDAVHNIWQVGMLANGGSAMLQVVAAVMTTGPIVNTAVAGAEQFDPDLSNNVSSAGVTATNPTPPPVISKRLFLASTLPAPTAVAAATAIAAASGAVPSPDVVRQDTAFVNELYRTLLHRDADPAGLSGWVTALLDGAPRTAVAQAIFESVEHRSLEVTGYYQTLLHRTPSASEVAGWVNMLAAGQTEANVIADFLGSAEYQASHASDAAFIAGLYQDVLGRTGSAAELQPWVQGLSQGLSRAQAIAYIMGSAEALGRLLATDYADFLGRAPDPTGAQGFLNALLAGGPALAEAVSLTLLGSDEFFMLAST